jgi:cytochrome c
MKRTFYSIVIIGAITIGLTSCGGAKKEEAKEGETTEETADDFATAEPEKASSEDLVAQGQALVDASDCKTCHHPTNKLVGPSHTDVAKKYEFTKANVTLLAGKIKNGGSGVWGEIPMSPHADLSQGDAEKMAMYVLSLDGEQPKD